MDPNKTTLERAFEIAAAGTAKSVPEIRDQLNDEGYDGKQIEGRSLKNQLRQILEKAKANAQGT